MARIPETGVQRPVPGEMLTPPYLFEGSRPLERPYEQHVRQEASGVSTSASQRYAESTDTRDGPRMVLHMRYVFYESPCETQRHIRIRKSRHTEESVPSNL